MRITALLDAFQIVGDLLDFFLDQLIGAALGNNFITAQNSHFPVVQIENTAGMGNHRCHIRSQKIFIVANTDYQRA
jgi:hypothetical protein